MSDQTLYRITQTDAVIGNEDVLDDLIDTGVLVPVEFDSRSFLCSEHHATGSSNRCRMAKFGFVDSPCLMERVVIFKIGVDDE